MVNAGRWFDPIHRNEPFKKIAMSKYKSSASFFSETAVHFNQGEEIDGSVYFSLTQRDKGFFVEVAGTLPAPAPLDPGITAHTGEETGELLLAPESILEIPPAANPTALQPAGAAANAIQHKETLLQHISDFEQHFVDWVRSAREKIESLFEAEPAD